MLFRACGYGGSSASHMIPSILESLFDKAPKAHLYSLFSFSPWLSAEHNILQLQPCRLHHDREAAADLPRKTLPWLGMDTPLPPWTSDLCEDSRSFLEMASDKRLPSPSSSLQAALGRVPWLRRHIEELIFIEHGLAPKAASERDSLKSEDMEAEFEEWLEETCPVGQKYLGVVIEMGPLDRIQSIFRMLRAVGPATRMAIIDNGNCVLFCSIFWTRFRSLVNGMNHGSLTRLEKRI